LRFEERWLNFQAEESLDIVQDKMKKFFPSFAVLPKEPLTPQGQKKIDEYLKPKTQL